MEARITDIEYTNETARDSTYGLGLVYEAAEPRVSLRLVDT
jgi:hypothetical protein